MGEIAPVSVVTPQEFNDKSFPLIWKGDQKGPGLVDGEPDAAELTPAAGVKRDLYFVSDGTLKPLGQKRINDRITHLLLQRHINAHNVIEFKFDARQVPQSYHPGLTRILKGI